MIDLYSWRTSNGRKVSIMLEECGLDYELHPVDIVAGEQYEPAFRTISPNGRIPAIVDRDGPGDQPLSLFESGAILLYLADKTASFLPAAAAARWTAIQWLMWQMGSIGPQFGQAFHFLHQAGAPAQAITYGRTRYGAEVRRLCAVMETRLADVAWLAGAEYSIADIAAFPWIALHRWLDIDLAATPHLARWYDAVRERPAVRRGMDVPTRLQLEHHSRQYERKVND